MTTLTCEPRLAGTVMSPFWILLELRMMEVVSGDIWSYKTYIRSSLIVIANKPTPSYYRPDALPVAQPTV